MVYHADLAQIKDVLVSRRSVMDERAGKSYRPWQPERYAKQQHSPASKLPQGDLVFFLLDIVPQLDLSTFYAYFYCVIGLERT